MTWLDPVPGWTRCPAMLDVGLELRQGRTVHLGILVRSERA
ncbi:hypothetical protein CEDDRAFT_02454 [Frankia sp. CeD]|nr:hypothetical protein CEDDRAFT_02454 [Frankia sp. CeD]